MYNSPMKQAELEQIIEQARLDRVSELDLRKRQISILPESIGNLSSLNKLYLRHNHLISLPESIGNLTNLAHLDLHCNQLSELPQSIDNLTSLIYLELSNNKLTSLPESIGNLTELISLTLCDNQLNRLPESIGNLTKLTHLHLYGNQLTNLPESIGNLSDLVFLSLWKNQLNKLPEGIGNLTKLTVLNPSSNIQLDRLPESIGNLTNLTELNLWSNQINILPENIGNLVKLTSIDLSGNPLKDLSILQSLPSLKAVDFLDIEIPRRYWIKFNDWKAEWLLDEDNAEVRRVLIEQVGYEKICEELNAIDLDTWREYTLLKIDGIEPVYDEDDAPIDREPMVLLKMTCPSTQHIHILRVPPEMTSAEAAITWVNHGIHPDEFAVQT
jgi:leucine-rich repeat protein SHOC2